MNVYELSPIHGGVILYLSGLHLLLSAKKVFLATVCMATFSVGSLGY